MIKKSASGTTEEASRLQDGGHIHLRVHITLYICASEKKNTISGLLCIDTEMVQKMVFCIIKSVHSIS